MIKISNHHSKTYNLGTKCLHFFHLFLYKICDVVFFIIVCHYVFFTIHSFIPSKIIMKTNRNLDPSDGSHARTPTHRSIEISFFILSIIINIVIITTIIFEINGYHHHHRGVEKKVFFNPS